MQARCRSIAPARSGMRLGRDVPPGPPPGFRGRHGFALITVIWSLGLLTLLCATVIVGARHRARTALTDGSVLAAAAAAESAVNFALASILSPTPEASFPKQCRMPGGEQAEIVVEEEVGKIDINVASLSTLERFFSALAQDKALGSKIALNAVNFRTAPQRTESGNRTAPGGTAPLNASDGAKGPGFSTILELDQIDGMSPPLLRAAMRFTTTLSGRSEPMPEAMSPALRLLMGLDPNREVRRRPPPSGRFTIRTDIRANNGSRYIREALVSFEASSGQPYTIREWRRGDIARETAASFSSPSPLRACFKL